MDPGLTLLLMAESSEGTAALAGGLGVHDYSVQKRGELSDGCVTLISCRI